MVNVPTQHWFLSSYIRGNITIEFNTNTTIKYIRVSTGMEALNYNLSNSEN